MEIGELVAMDIDREDDWECPFAHDKPGKVKNDLRPAKSDVLGTSLGNGTSTQKWESVAGVIKPKRIRDPALAEPKLAAVRPPHTVMVALDHLGNTVPLPFSISAHHLIPSDASLPKSHLKHYISGGKIIDGDIGYGVNGAENGVWLPTHQALSQDMPVLPFEQAKKAYADISDEGNELVGSTISHYANAVMEQSTRQFHDSHPNYSNFVTKVLNKIQANLAIIKNFNCKKCQEAKSNSGKLPPPHGLVFRLNAVSRDLERRLLGNPMTWRSPVYTSRYAKELTENARRLRARGRS